MHDLTGMRYGRLVVLEKGPQIIRASGKVRTWRCRCDCGNHCNVPTSGLRTGQTVSCGCRRKETQRGDNLVTHGLLRHGKPREYHIWRAAKDRCYRPRCSNYANYGGRGIRMCDDWRDDFAAFLRDMGPAPKGMTLDRIDPNGDYSPSNCRWASYSEQAFNRRKKLRILCAGREMNLEDAARIVGLNYDRLRYAFHRLPGLSAEEIAARVVGGRIKCAPSSSND